MMDVWEEQLKSPMAGSPSAILSKLKSLPNMSPIGTWPNAVALQTAAMNPLQFWMQFTEQWQKAWADAMTSWTGKPNDRTGERRQTAR
jgi:hypothetical protein